MTNFKASELLIELNDLLLSHAEERTCDANQPVIFVAGPPRSGTTLFTQVLINSFIIAYIDNISSKFWNAPQYGITLSKELKSFEERLVPFKSDFGFSSELLGPQEFGYFWKRFFDYSEHDRQSEIHLRQVKERLRKTVQEMIFSSGLPLVLKNPVPISLNADHLVEIFPEAFFIFLKRDSYDTGMSLLKGREKKTGKRREWFSGRPGGYKYMREKEPEEQVVWQLKEYYSVEQRAKELITSSGKEFLEVEYKSLCQNPAKVVDVLDDFFNGLLRRKKPASFEEVTCSGASGNYNRKLTGFLKKYDLC